MNRLAIVIAVLLLLSPQTPAEVLRFDLGVDTSAVWDGFTAVTLSNSGKNGWTSVDSLTATGRRYEAREGDRRPPAIWTNPITEDGHLSVLPNTFLVDVPPGRYQVFALCGTSGRERDRFFDFTISVPGDSARVQIEGGLDFRSVRLNANVGDSPLRVDIAPRSAWCISALVISSLDETPRVEREIIKPIEDWTYRLPPQESAKWEFEAGPVPPPLPELSAEQMKRGFVLHARPWEEPVYPHTRPSSEDLDPKLRLFASQDEYEPVTFTLHALRELDGIRVQVGDIGPVSSADIDVRRVAYVRARPNYQVRNRYRIVPDFIERFETIHLEPHENVRFWVTLYVRKGTPAGIYNGSAVVTTSRDTVQVPIRLRVLPFQLRENPDRLYSIYYRHPYDRMRQAADPVSREYFRRKAEREHIDMAAHGIRNTVLSVWSPAADEQGRFAFDWDHLQAKLDLWKQVGFRGPIVMGIPTENVYRKHVGKGYGSHLSDIEVPPEPFAAEMTDMVRVIEAERKDRGWPEFLYYPVDEPGRDSTAIAFMTAVLKSVKAAGVRTYLTASPVSDAFQPLRPYVDVWSTQPFLPAREQALAEMEAQDIEYWCYPNHVNGENDHTPVAGARMTFGFGFWQSGFRALNPWIYSWSVGSPRNNLDGFMSDFFNGHEPDGAVIPVAMWEAYREGWDDARYIYTLESLIQTASNHAIPEVRQAAANAQEELDGIWDAIPVQPKYKYDNLWAPSEYTVYRWLIAREILQLQNLL